MLDDVFTINKQVYNQIFFRNVAGSRFQINQHFVIETFELTSSFKRCWKVTRVLNEASKAQLKKYFFLK